MNTGAGSGGDRYSKGEGEKGFRRAPITRAIALALAAGGMGGAMGGAQAAQAFGAAWFANKSAVQGAAAATGRMPDGRPASMLSNPMAQQRRDNAQLQRSLDNLNMAARGIASQQAAQEAARKAALLGDSAIPDGLAEGGLQVDTRSLTAGWLNARAPVQTAADGRTQVTIEQTQEKAILNWESFNVGRNTTVQFDQRGGAKPDGTNGWIALNRVNDPSGRPSQIAGQIKADGSVYIVNRNGIIFNGSSQVNTRTLVASSLSLSDQQFKLGINNAQVFPDAFQGQGDAFGIPQFGDFTSTRPDINLGFEAGQGGMPDRLGGVDRFVPAGVPGAVQVQAGAQLDVDSGGKIMLFAPKVNNAGRISAPDGQVILAAGENVYLNASRLNERNGVRGLDVAVSATPGWAFAWTHLFNALTTGTSPYNPAFTEALATQVLPEMAARAEAIGFDVTNTGIVQSERGNVTLQARDVHQNGVALATTALDNRNGSILMRAWGLGTHAYQNSDTNDVLLNWASGTLTLGEGSVTRVLPDAADTGEIETTALATRYQPGWIGLYGQLIDFKPRAGVLVPSGTIDMESAVNPLNIQLPYFRPTSLDDGSRIYMDSGSFASVAGLQGAAVPMSRNFIEAELRINELRDSPLLLASWLRGKKVIVDRRTAGIFEDGPMAGVEWVKDSAGNYVPGAWAGTPLADVTGWIGVGMTDLQELSTDAGKITMRAGGSFISREGSLLDVSGGSVRYLDGMNTATKLMGTDGRVHAMDRATSDIDYVGIAGQYAREHPRWGVSENFSSSLIGRDMLEAGYTEGRKAGSVQIFAGGAMVLEGDYWGGVVVGDRQQKQPAKNVGGRLELGGGSVEDRPWSPGELIVSHNPHRLAAGFDATTVLGDDFSSAPREGHQEPADKLSYVLDDTLTRSGMGRIVFNLRRDFLLDAGAVVELSPGASIAVSGGEGSTSDMVVNGTLRAAGGAIGLDTSLGKLSIGATGRIDTAGQWINEWQSSAVPSRWAIDAGTITLLGGELAIDPGAVLDVSGGARLGIGGKGLPVLRAGNAGAISLNGLGAETDLGALDMRAYAAGSAGRLNVVTPAAVQIGGERTAPEVVWLRGDLYGARGFGTVIVDAAGGIAIPEGAQVTQRPSSLLMEAFDYRSLPTGATLADAAPVGVLRPEERFARQPTLLSVGSAQGNITVGAGAQVRTDNGGRIVLKTEAGALLLGGTLNAPGGIIDLEGKAITLEAGAQLLARGVPLIYRDSQGRMAGQVLDGGVVTVGTGSASLDLKAGSLIDVSGATGEIDGAPANRFSLLRSQPLTLDSNGGSIRVSGTGLVESTLRGRAGGASASGGRLQLDLRPPASAGGTPLEQLQNNLLDPDCYGFSGDGICGAWTEGLDYDWAPGLRDWGYSIPGSMIIPSSLLAHLRDSNEIVLSDTIAQPGAAAPLDPAQFGLTQEVLDLFRDNFFFSDLLRDVLRKPGQQHALTVRPSAFREGGFADLAMAGAVRLDGVDLSLGRSIEINGPMIGHKDSSSVLRAPHIVLNAVGETPGSELVRAAPAAEGATGQLELIAQLIDIRREGVAGVAGANISGFGRTVLEGREIRLGGELPGQIQKDTNFEVSLDVDGKLVLRAGQVYPSTGMTGVVRAGDSITVERLAGSDADAGMPALSAGGTLRLQAPVIEQNGVLRAPFGQIELEAGTRLALGAGSITSVSGGGMVVPYGTLVNNEHWHDPTQPVDNTGSAGGTLAAPPEKRITLKAPDVGLAPGAVVDIAGGGDLYAWEFVPGPGGSHDVLNVPGMRAILPGYGSAAPASGIPAGERVWLAGGPGLAAGWYTLLPARYALLPGAFAVQTSGRDWSGPAGVGAGVADGSFVVQGRQGNAYDGATAPTATAWRVLPGSTLRKYTEYNEAFANDFFSSDAFRLTQYRLTGQEIVTPRLPRDGGALVFDATQRLTLDGTLRSQPDAGGRGGLVDIAGRKIAIVGAGEGADDLRADGYLVVDAASLSNFGAGSLLVGGKRRGDPLGLSMEVTASDIVVRNGADSELSGPEIILAASDRVEVAAGSIVSTKGAASSGGGKLIVKPREAAVYTDPDGQLDDNGDGVIDARDAKDDVLTSHSRDWGAVVRLSNGDIGAVVRENVDTGRGGLVRIGEGASIAGGASLLIDATRTTELAGSARVSAADLSVASGRIGFGGGSEGMVLDSTSLAQLSNSSHLTLRSYSSFDFYRSMDLGAAGLASLTFDGAAFAGLGGGDIVIRGETVALANSGAAAVPSAGAGAGTFTLDAGTLVLGAGAKTFGGFGTVVLGGRERIVGEGSGSTDAGASALTLRTPLLTGRGGAQQSLSTQDVLRVVAPEGVAATDAAAQDLQDSLGTRLSLSGRSVVLGTRAAALGGSVEITATGGSVVVGDGARIDVGGFAKRFFDVEDYADAGRISLSALGGDIRLDAGSSLNLAADANGGSAGTLTLAASNGGTVTLDGRIAAQAGQGGKAGAFSLDIAALPDFAGFSQRLNEAGFNRSRQFRIRQGDVVLDGSTTVEDFGLTADGGRVDITGTIDARAPYGGAIRIVGGNGVAMQAGARLLAGATGDHGSGRITLEAAGGQLDLRGGLLDVAGGDAGTVRLRALRTAGNDEVAVANLRLDVTGARSAVLEGVSVYDSTSVDAVKAQAIADADAFMSRAGAIQARLGSLGTGLALMPGIEIRSQGDLSLGSDWNLFADFAQAREGSLTLRAAGNLLINGNLSDGFDAAGRAGVLQDAASWNLRLVAGGDLASADALALRPPAAQVAGQGSIVIGTANTAQPTDPVPDNGAGWMVRTGTGDIEVRAGRDLTLAHTDSVIYTAGRRDTESWSDFTTANPNAVYGIAGGNLDLRAQGDISARPSEQRYTEWLHRQGNVNSGFFFGEYLSGRYGTRPDGTYGPLTHPAEQSSWWVDPGAFRQGVGVLGGGNVTVSAGGDLDNLSVSLATTLRTRGGRTTGEAMTTEIRNGGAMTVDAGGAIRGGQYYLARGAGSIQADETAVGRSVTVRKNTGGSAVTTTVYAIAPVIALGDATMDVRTAGDLRLQTVIDPLLVRHGDGYDSNGQTVDDGAYMSGYTARTALNLSSTGGDITLVNQGQFIFKDLQLFNNTTPSDGLVGKGANRYPAMTHATAMNGSLEIQGPMYVMPAADSDLRLLAQRDLRFTNADKAGTPETPFTEIVMSRATPEMMPSATAPLGGGGAPHQVDLDALLRNVQGPFVNIGATQKIYYEGLQNPEVLTLANDHEASRIYAAQGSILGLDVTASEQTWVRAGTDIRGLRLDARNVHAQDVSLLEAGNDILSMAGVRGAGPGLVTVQGAGALVLSAGRDVYADDLDIRTLGNQSYDSANRPIEKTRILGLPEQGASVTVMAGMNRPAAYEAFQAAYLDPSKVAAMPDYLKTRGVDGSVLPVYLTDLTETRPGGQEKVVRRGLVSYMQDMTGETLAPLDAWARFEALAPLARQQFLRQVYLLELRDAGRDQNEPGVGGLPRNAGFNRGYAAIAALFPGDTWKGDVAANKLMLRTMAGGDIDVLTPGGGLQIAALGATVPAGYGLVTLASGHIGIAAKDDVVVNRSRILSFVPEASGRGSDQIIWSSTGDIDAGRGAKTVRVPSAPEVLTDLDGTTVIREKSDMSGSGIGTVGDGDVDLVAPKGTINAGDAGIRVAGNLNLFALQVLNADNIQVKGESKGIPVVAAVNIGALTSASAAASQAAMAAQDTVQRERSAARQALPSIFTVRVLGFGNEPAPGAETSPPALPGGRPPGSAQYDPKNRVQVVGHGQDLKPELIGHLTDDELRRLRQGE